jgi:hypothetical protein
VSAPERVARYDFGPSVTRVESSPYDAEAHGRRRALGYVE